MSLAAVAAMMLSLMLSVLWAPSASATHYRANQLTWHTTATPGEVELHLSGSWRCTFFSSPCALSPGDTINAGALNYGDGTPGTATVFTVVSVDPLNDVVTAEAHISHTYAGTGPFTVSLTDCCRLSSGGGHLNNPDGSIQLLSTIDLAKDVASPVSLVSPIVDCPLNSVCTFTVPAVDANGQPLSWRMSTPSEAGGGFKQPVGATIDPATGLYRWDTTGAALAPSGSTFYSTQVMIENIVGGVVVSSIPVDFFIRLGSNSTNQQPVFVSPTPADGSTINVSLGSAMSFTTSATDPDSGDVVTLAMLGKPADATYTTTSGNPASGTFTWTPTTSGSYLLTLTAADQLGLGAVPRSVTIVVGTGAAIAATPEAPTVVQAACVDGAVTSPSVTAATTSGITYAMAGDQIPGGTVTVTATAANGYTLLAANGWTAGQVAGTATYTVTLDPASCPTPTPTPTKPPKGPKVHTGGVVIADQGGASSGLLWAGATALGLAGLGLLFVQRRRRVSQHA